uniref:Uncharacterized protein n=1 Tax=Triticum urartu TaxID=4572 RepID=A0A8R7NZG1_TRIUA
KKDIANITRQLKCRIIRKQSNRRLKGVPPLQSSGLLKIDVIDGSGDRLDPKVRRKRGSDYQRTSRLKKVTMLALNHTIAILSMCTRTRDPCKITLLGKDYM